MSQVKAKGLDHVAIAVKDLDKAIPVWRDALGLGLPELEVVEEQKVRTAIFGHGMGRIELICPTEPDTGVAKFLEKRGEGLHHVCFATDDVAAELEATKAKGIPLIDQAPRKGLAGMICFLHPKAQHGVLIEYAEPFPDDAAH